MRLELIESPERRFEPDTAPTDSDNTKKGKVISLKDLKKK